MVGGDADAVGEPKEAEEFVLQERTPVEKNWSAALRLPAPHQFVRNLSNLNYTRSLRVLLL